MTKQQIIEKVKTLNLPVDSYVVYGSCPMAVAGIREAGDVDMYVTTELLSQLKAKGWKQIHKGPKDEPYTYDVFEAHDNWEFSDYHPSFEQLQSNAVVVGGVPFASLQDVRKWKAASDNPKFMRDVELIDEYLQKQPS